MEEKLEKVKKLTGGGAIPMSTEDLEKDFDPEEHDKQMKVWILCVSSLQ